MIKNYGDRYHLIDKKALEDKKLDRDQLEEFLKLSGIMDIGKNYNIVSIIGSQSTGKSTLLNYLFGTKFDVQNRQQSVGQTTVGIWISKDIQNNILVLDVEGSDSVERKQGENMVENQTALMAFTMSHCFIINVFVNALGQHTSCQLSIMKIIMQQNLKLFQQDNVKHIMFVVRDWDEDSSYEEASRRLNGYLLNIWNEIPKPDQYQKTHFHELFSVQVVTLVQYKMKKEFAEQTNELHSKLANKQDPNFIFNNFEYEKNIRCQDMPSFISNIWEVISNNKDLNLPNEKILISHMRCQQIKLEALESVKQLNEDLQNRVKVQLVDNFGEQCQSILSLAKKIYDKDAKDYHIVVYKEKEKELKDELIIKLFTIFQRYVEQLKQYYMNKLSEQFEILKKESIYELSDKLNELHLLKVNFQEQLLQSIIEIGIWQEEDHIKSFNLQFDNYIKSFVEAQLAKFKQQLDNIIKSECDKIVSQQILNISPKFWFQVETDYYLMILDKHQQYDVLLIGLRVQEIQIDDYMYKFEKDSFQNLKQAISDANGRFKDQLFQQFKTQFVRTSDGQPRNWQMLTEEEIFHFYTEARDKVFSLLDLLRIGKTKFISLQATIKQKSTSFIIPQGTKIQYQISSDTDSDDIVLNEVSYTQIKMQLAEEIDIQYQGAIQKHLKNI